MVRDVAHRSHEPATKCAQRGLKLQPFGRSCGSGSWPGMGISGLSFLFVPDIAIERNRPCV
jgi:hypothetical protein